MFFHRIIKPRLSLIVVVYNMPAQAKKTLYSLSGTYQRHINVADYEVIVVENMSDHMLTRETVRGFGPNFTYYPREETSPSPVGAINFGVQKAIGKVVGIMVDGARMVTPGVVRYVLMAYQITPNAVVSVPGYHLGDTLQQEVGDSGYNEFIEENLLKQIDWPKDGYRLFDVACFSGTCAGGFFKPIGESNCFCLSKNLYIKSGGCDPRFDLPGGGFINLDLYKQLCDMKETTLFILPGEGTFHQYHRGVTTSVSADSDRSALIERLRNQYIDIRGVKFSPPQKKAIYLGTIPESVQRFVRSSSEQAIVRYGSKS